MAGQSKDWGWRRKQAAKRPKRTVVVEDNAPPPPPFVAQISATRGSLWAILEWGRGVPRIPPGTETAPCTGIGAHGKPWNDTRINEGTTGPVPEDSLQLAVAVGRVQHKRMAKTTLLQNGGCAEVHGQ